MPYRCDACFIYRGHVLYAHGVSAKIFNSLIHTYMFSVIFHRDVFALYIESMSYMHTEFLPKDLIV